MRYTQTGLVSCDPAKATPGFTLFTPLNQSTSYLVDLEGKVVHQWALPAHPGNYARLLPNGNLFAACADNVSKIPFNAKGGRMVELDWKGNIVWEYIDSNQHHDFHRKSNGNTIYLAWEKMPAHLAARVKGGRPGSELNGDIYSEYIREVSPKGETVWEWHVEGNQEIENYPICPVCPRAAFAHGNSIWAMDNGDVMVSWRHNHLIAIIDRETKKFKWEMRDAILGHQHDFHVLPNGHFLVFANGAHTFGPGIVPGGGGGSRVLEIDPATKKIVWEYYGEPGYVFNSPFISGAQRLPSGNTLICEGNWGYLFEVTPAREIVWEYINPFPAPATLPRDAAKTRNVFRAYRYAADSPEIRGRLS